MTPPVPVYTVALR